MSGDEAPAVAETLETDCCVVGGGPAGMVLGFLLARAGVNVVVLEKHGDFLRDFRGDTIHPSTLQVMHELGLLDEFLKRPHQEARVLSGVVGDVTVPVADFSHLPTRCRFIAFMPQWDFLDFVAGQARRYPSFRLRMRAEAVDLLEDGGNVVGVRATTPNGPLEVRARLTVGSDGRSSTVRSRAGLTVENLGAPIDVLWMRLTRSPTDPDQPLGRFDRGKVFVMLFRGEYWQCGFVIKKGGIDELRRRGIESFVDRLRTWHRPGLLCIGDAAHAMSPIGGVGINLAIQDAVAAANLLAGPLRRGRIGPGDFAKVQKRRMFPTRVTQRLQVLIQDRVLGRVLGSGAKLTLPWPLRLFQRLPFLRRIPARLIGMGFRPEHVRTPDVLGPP
ncbi:MAG: FAD-dependent oxidoreductase [Planctomycetia bacterium]|nr:FAD-dependent oxidoreductase [Planctomycetia bacterium]